MWTSEGQLMFLRENINCLWCQVQVRHPSLAYFNWLKELYYPKLTKLLPSYNQWRLLYSLYTSTQSGTQRLLEFAKINYELEVYQMATELALLERIFTELASLTTAIYCYTSVHKCTIWDKDDIKFPRRPTINVSVLTGGFIEHLLHIQSEALRIREINKKELQSPTCNACRKTAAPPRWYGHEVKTKHVVV